MMHKPSLRASSLMCHAQAGAAAYTPYEHASQLLLEGARIQDWLQTHCLPPQVHGEAGSSHHC